jgi:copper chaperone CopZ
MIRFKILKIQQNLLIMENSIKHTYHISGMSCGGCVTDVKNKLSTVNGVTSVQVDLAKKEAEITSTEKIKADALQDALKNTHYTISEHSAA